MEKETSTSPSLKKSEEIKPSFSYDQLLQAMYWTWDAFDRALMPTFLVYETAQTVIDHQLPDGNAIYFGVRKNEWNAGARTVVYNFTGFPKEKTEKYEVFSNPFNRVPVYVYLFDEDPCIINTAVVMYEREYFNLPNTYKQFVERFGNRE